MKAKVKVNYSKLSNFHFKEIGKSILLTNEGGDWIFLSKKQFNDFLRGEFSKNDKKYLEISEKGFLSPNKRKIEDLSGRYFRMHRSILQGPSLFIFVLTLRCNHRCLYCQVTPEGPGKKGFDMNKKTAKQAVDLAFETSSPYLRIEFQGGEPLLNWPVLKFIVEYAQKINEKKQKNLEISLVSNLVLMSAEKLKFLIKERVQISCSFDGPAQVHDQNRVYLFGKSSYKIISKKIEQIKKELKKNTISVDSFGAILTVSKKSLFFYKEIIDEYLKKGFKKIMLRPLSPFGLEKRTVNLVGYPAEEFINFYKKSLDYILEINKKGKKMIESNAFYILVKILGKNDPNYTEMSSPCGAAIGQMAFNYDGRIFSCDEGRMASRMGCENFKLGKLGKSNMKNIIDNETTKTLCLASCLDNQVACQDCVYKPYCGTCPVANFLEYGDLFPQISQTDKCKISKAIFDYIFIKIKKKENRAIFEKWLKIGRF